MIIMHKKLFFVFIVLAIVVGIYIISQPETINFSLKNQQVKLLVARTPAQWQRGLMFYQKPIPDFDGMLFIFPEKQTRTFWNKNTYLDLEVYWLDDNNIVGQESLPSIAKSGEVVQIQSPQAVNQVVEIIR